MVCRSITSSSFNVFFGVIIKFDNKVWYKLLYENYLVDSNMSGIFIICMSLKILYDIVWTLLLFT